MKKGLTCVLTGLLLTFYAGIVVYVFFLILHIDELKNFEAAMAFEIIGFLILITLVMSNLLTRRIKTGFFAPLITVTVFYTIILHVINMACVLVMPPVFFVLLNLVLLFIYCLISMPMYIMGRR